jgi:hypothetical protein
MRIFDKLKNLNKANILAEQRYLDSKDTLNEFEIHDYADLADKTGDYPWTNNFDKSGLDYNDPNRRGNIEATGNMLGKNGFESKFYEKYPKGDVKIKIFDSNDLDETGKPKQKEAIFHMVKFNSNHMNYDVLFDYIPDNKWQRENKLLWIKNDQLKGYYLDKNSGITIASESEPIIVDMLKYNNTVRGKNPKQV